MNALQDIADELVARVGRLRFAGPVTHVYNPLVYAREVYAEYLRRFGRGTREVVMFGMNPGPWGMTQTGVPFGEISAVRDWMSLGGTIVPPRKQHPKVPVMGFACHRCEVSGQRLWGWARETFGPPEAFFERFFVANYCPLAFLEESGRNRTPDKLSAAEKEELFATCDEAVRATIAVLRPRYAIGIGGFAAGRLRAALANWPGDGGAGRIRTGASVGKSVDKNRQAQAPAAKDMIVGEILHPSPASPAANRGWRKVAMGQMRELGIEFPQGACIAEANRT